MSRKYLNDKYCVRCGRRTPTPYLRDNYERLLDDGGDKRKPKDICVVDLGCGNGRNSQFMKSKGHTVIPLDMVNDYGFEVMLGREELPVPRLLADIVLCNYLLMFLSKAERKQIIREIKKISHSGTIIMVELYPAKDSFAKTKEEMLEMQKEIFDSLGWEKIRYSQARFIAKSTKF